MTRASTEQQQQFVPWFAKAGAACSIVPIARFVNDHLFALKGGGYGCLFALSGMDEEGLTDRELESHLRMIEGALRGLPEGACLYQYTRVRAGFELPRKGLYENPVTHTFVSDRMEFLESTAGFRRIDLHWCLTLEPSRVKSFERKPDENAAATSRMLAELDKTAALLAGNLASSIGLRLLDKQSTFQFFSYLFSLEDWAEWGQLRSDAGVDRQIVQTPVAWESDHLRIGRRFVQMYSLKTTPEASRPCLFADLLKLDCDSILCSAWKPKSTATARHEIDQQEKFISFFKVGVLSRVMAGKDTASLDTGAGAKAANVAVDDLSEVIRSLDKKAQGEYSLRLLVATRSASELHSLSPAVHRVFVEARAQVMEETLGNLSAFYAMFPGNGRFNVFPMWLGEDHYARLSSVFAPNIGHPHSEDLDSEYLNVFQTRTGTPFFQDAYVDGVRVQLILGPTGSGKTATLQEIDRGLRNAGHEVIAIAPTRSAVEELRKVGFQDAMTVARLLEDQTAQSSLTRKVLIVDEAGMISGRQMENLVALAERAHARVLFSGDTRQIQSVEASDALRILERESQMKSVSLNSVQRQIHPEYRDAIQTLRQSPSQGFEKLDAFGAVREVPFQDRAHAIASAYREATSDPSRRVLVVAATHEEIGRVTRAIRDDLKERGQLAQGVSLDRHISLQWTQAQKADLSNYRAGQVVVFHRAVKGIEKQEALEVVGRESNSLTVRNRHGEQKALTAKQARLFSVHERGEIEVAPGDKLLFTGNRKEADFRATNGELVRVKSVEQGRIRLKDGRTIPTNYRDFDHGYAVTAHRSQGKTVDSVIVSADAMKQELFYVAASRGRHEVTVITSDRAQLRESLGISTARPSVMELARSIGHEHDSPLRETAQNHAKELERSSFRPKSSYDHSIGIGF